MTVLSAPAPQTGTSPQAAEQRLLLCNVSWADYATIGNVLRDRPALRMTYDRGSLEFMVTSSEHEKYKKRLARLLDLLSEEFNLPMVSAGNMTFQREDLQRALEPDDCFWIAHEPQVRGRLDWDPARDPPPDLVVEIEISRSALDRMAIYAVLGVPEIWRFDGNALRAEILQPDQTYRPAERSPTFPSLPLGELVRFVRLGDQTDSLSVSRAFRDWVRQLSKE